MNAEIKIFPLKFEQAFRYVTDQLQDGHTLARELLINLDFKEGSFFALLHPSADKTKIHEFYNLTWDTISSELRSIINDNFQTLKPVI